MRRTLLLLTSIVLLAGCGWLSAQAAAPAAPAIALASPVGAADGQVRLWQDAAIFGPVRRLLDGAGAGQPLWVEMYEFGRADLSSALQRARDRGADVRLIVDRTVPASARTADRLAAAGPAARAYPAGDSRTPIDQLELVLTAGAAPGGGPDWGENSRPHPDHR